MTVLLKPLSESLAMPIAALQNFTTAAAKRCFSKIWNGLGTELELKESRENFARSIFEYLVAIILQMFFSNGLVILNIPQNYRPPMAAQKGSRARSSRIPADWPIDVTDASRRVLIRGMHDN